MPTFQPSNLSTLAAARPNQAQPSFLQKFGAFDESGKARPITLVTLLLAAAAVYYRGSKKFAVESAVKQATLETTRDLIDSEFARRRARQYTKPLKTPGITD